jgi:hypothetical protein
MTRPLSSSSSRQLMIIKPPTNGNIDAFSTAQAVQSQSFLSLPLNNGYQIAAIHIKLHNYFKHLASLKVYI